MFKPKAQRELDKFQEAMADVALGVPAMVEKWQYFCDNVHLRDKISLLRRVQMFSYPARQWANKKYRSIKKAGALPFYVMVFTAIRCAGTHSEEEVKSALAEFYSETGTPPFDALIDSLVQVNNLIARQQS